MTRSVGRVGLGLLLALVLIALTAPWLAPYDPDARSGVPFDRPSREHLLGTNDVGQDLLSELIFGARVSLGVGVAAALAATLIGAAVGVSAGYRRGWPDAVLMRGVDVVLALPVLPLTIVIGVFAGPGLRTQVAVIAAVIWAPVARELRAQVLSLRERDHIAALRAMGAPTRYMLPRHVLPAVVPLMVPQFVLATKSAIGLEASLAFLGLGDVNSKSWGSMLSVAYARSAFLTDAWIWWVIPPGLAIAVTVLAFALLGYGLEERTQPRLRDHAPRTPGATPVAREIDAAGAAVLQISALTVGYGSAPAAAADVDLAVGRGEILGLVGGSGSGKSTVGAAACGLLPTAARVRAGQIRLDGVAVVGASRQTLQKLRGRRIALIPQESMSALNPVHDVRSQLVEALRAHPRPDTAGRLRRTSRAAAAARAGELLALVGLPASCLGAYPHQLSGGMRQRVVIAIAVASDPVVLVADEPTSGLDVVMARQILDLLDDLRARLGLAVLLISHDLGAVARICDRMAVMRSGRVIETASTQRLLGEPEHPWTRELLAALDPPALPPPDAPFGATVLAVGGLTVTYRRGGIAVPAVTDLHLQVAQGEVVGLIGGSGAGKSTVARALMGLAPATGTAQLGGVDVLAARPRAARAARRAAHLVFQDPYAALPPNLTVEQIVAEPLRLAGGLHAADRSDRVAQALAAVRLDPDRMPARYPHQLSGGERQRVAIARALVGRPRLIVADEPTQMLDASLRLEIVDLLDELRRRHGVAILHITHDLALARRSCDRLVVMQAGRVVESGATEAVLNRPQHPYTAELIAAAFAMEYSRWP